MKTRYSKRVREEAALICAIAASTPSFGMCLTDVAIAIGLDRHTSRSLHLACNAWWHHSLIDSAWDAERAAAAEQYIRTGWPDCP